MNIVFLEDNIHQQIYLEKLSVKLSKTFLINKKNILITSKLKDVINCAKQNIGNTLFFLDLEIYGDAESGYKVAEEIRKFDSFSNIVIVTSHAELMRLTLDYKISAVDFIEKESLTIENKIIENVILFRDKILASLPSKMLTIENKFEKFQIPISQIFYIETTHIPHKLHLVGEYQDIIFYGKLKNMLELDPLFMLAHRSNLINIANIKHIDKKKHRIVFRDGKETLLVSRYYFGSIVKSLKNITDI